MSVIDPLHKWLMIIICMTILVHPKPHTYVRNPLPENIHVTMKKMMYEALLFKF